MPCRPYKPTHISADGEGALHSRLGAVGRHTAVVAENATELGVDQEGHRTGLRLEHAAHDNATPRTTRCDAEREAVGRRTDVANAEPSGVCTRQVVSTQIDARIANRHL